jgi:hypothetical protein
MANENERMQILELIESGKITPSEGLVLLDALNGVGPSLLEEASAAAEVPAEETGAREPDLPISPPSPAAPAPPAPALPVEAPNSIEGQGDQVYPLQEQPELTEEPVVPEMPFASAEVTQLQGSAPEAAAYDRDFPPVEETREPPAQGEVVSPPTLGPDFSRWRHFWEIPLWVGVGITVLSGVLMYLAWQGSGLGFWFACTWLPFFLGVAVIALAWGTRNLPWLHVRIQQKRGERPQRINISLPLPLGVIGWALRTFRHKIPDTGNVNIEEMVKALKHVTPEAPFSVDVNEGQDGEHVQIYIG